MTKRQIWASLVANYLASNLQTAAYQNLYQYDPYYGCQAPRALPSTRPNETDKPNQDEDRSKKEKHSRQAEDEQLNDALRSTIRTQKSKVQWQDVAGLDVAKNELQMAAEMPNRFPKLFTGGREPRQFILLYGPPGTGKGQLVKALASAVDSTLIVLSSSDIQSKWHGESERLVRLSFENARRNKPSVIFFDEVEALCSSRTDGSSEHDNRVKTEFLVQMDGTAYDNNGVLFIAATNLPWKLDSAFRRRLQKKIHIALPDKDARRSMIKMKLGNSPCKLSALDYEALAAKTEGFSGSDITNLVQEALMEPMKQIHEATHWCEVTHNGRKKLRPCQQSDTGAKAMTWRDVSEDDLLEPTVKAGDFRKALARTKPSVGQEELQQYDEWTKLYGTEGA